MNDNNFVGKDKEEEDVDDPIQRMIFGNKKRKNEKKKARDTEESKTCNRILLHYDVLMFLSINSSDDEEPIKMAFSKKMKDNSESETENKQNDGIMEMIKKDGKEEEAAAAEEEEAVSMMDLLQQMMKSKKSSNTPGPDGSHSTTPGPAPCKLKHWYEGREVDFITKYAGKHVLGFNVDDNPLIVARDFVAKYNLNPNSTDNSQLITKIADMIRETVNEKTGTGDDKLDVEHLIEDGAKVGPYADDPIIRPYGEAGGVHAVYNHQTKQVDLIHYHNEVDSEKIKQKMAASKTQKKKKQQEDHDVYKRKKEQEMEEARRKILAMRKEQKSSDGPTFGYVPKSTGGATGGGMHSLRDVSSGGSGGGTVIGKATAAAVSPGKVKHKKEWDEKYMVERFKKGGSAQFIKDLEEAEFTDEEKAMVMFKLNAMMMYKDSDDEEEGSGLKMARTEEEEVWKGEGHTLGGAGGSGESEGNNNHAEIREEDTSEVVVDQSCPTTQIRLSVPGRPSVTAVFNLTHTVADIRRYVNRHAPLDRPYHLQLLRPPTRLDDSAQTIQAAKLEKSTITIVFV